MSGPPHAVFPIAILLKSMVYFAPHGTNGRIAPHAPLRRSIYPHNRALYHRWNKPSRFLNCIVNRIGGGSLHAWERRTAPVSSRRELLPKPLPREEYV